MTQVYAAVQSGQYAAVLPANAENGIPQSIAKAYTLPELTPFTRQIALIYKHETSMDATKAKVLDFLRETID
jgi:DNA-binding transcriptional LysR family regulator